MVGKHLIIWAILAGFGLRAQTPSKKIPSLLTEAEQAAKNAPPLILSETDEDMEWVRLAVARTNPNSGARLRTCYDEKTKYDERTKDEVTNLAPIDALNLHERLIAACYAYDPKLFEEPVKIQKQFGWTKYSLAVDGRRYQVTPVEGSRIYTGSDGRIRHTQYRELAIPFYMHSPRTFEIDPVTKKVTVKHMYPNDINGTGWPGR